MSVSVRAREGAPRQCPFCRDEASEDVAPCACGVTYHPECRAELSRCVTIGCAGKAGEGRGAHRDVSCVRCKGLINNDGDMCFGCWSPFHRRCLAAGCCARPPTTAGEHEPVVVSPLNLLLAAVFYLSSMAVLFTLVVRIGDREWLIPPWILLPLGVGLVVWASRLIRRSRAP